MTGSTASRARRRLASEPRSGGGTASGAMATFTPMPSTTHASCGAPLDEDAGELRQGRVPPRRRSAT